ADEPDEPGAPREPEVAGEDEPAAPESAGEDGIVTLQIIRFSLVCVQNSTGHSINYRIRWGTADWKSFTIEAGRRHFHGWEYNKPGNVDSPNLRIRFDSDMTAGTSWVEYNLPYNSS